jgi:hypothetical protein
LDLALLSEHCHEMIVTGGSTFGFLANMYAGKLSYFINGELKVKPPSVNTSATTTTTTTPRPAGGVDMFCQRATLARPPFAPLGYASF